MKVAIYCRLSEEDRNKQFETDDSNSIQNQKAMLMQYAAEQRWELYNIYSDDDYTGSDRRRPEFNRLLKDAEARKFDIILCKTQSRFTRELELVEKYIHGLFPIWGIRFVSIVDNADTANKGNKKSRQINGLVNEWYLEDMSENIRSVLTSRRQNGFHIGAFALYGYKKDPNDKNSLIVDEEAAEVVKSIYHWFVNEGYSKMGIAKRLNQMGEPNPEAYKKKKGFKYNNPNSDKNDGLWSASTIARILQNEIYTGVMVQGRHRVISYKVHKQISVPEDEWFVVPNTHEAIIDRETFEKAQALHKRDTRTAPGKQEVYLMSGFVRCADCQKAMRRKTARNIAYYSCRSYTDKKICSKHSIRQDKLENAVLAALQMQIALVDRLAEEIERINNAPVINRESKRLSHSLKQAEKQLKQYNDASDSLYLDWKSGEITKEEYRRLKGKIAEQIQQLEANISYLKEEMQVMADGIGTDDPYLTAFLKHKNIQSLNRGIMVELVKAVWVHENGEITVDFNFADEYQRIIDYIENNHNVIRVIENKAI